jgi:hypothetical protein
MTAALARNRRYLLWASLRAALADWTTPSCSLRCRQARDGGRTTRRPLNTALHPGRLYLRSLDPGDRLVLQILPATAIIEEPRALFPTN